MTKPLVSLISSTATAKIPRVKNPPEFDCKDCNKSTFRSDYNYYMVKNELWAKAFGAGPGMLCIPCLEKRIGRELVIDDFAKVPLNVGYLMKFEEVLAAAREEMK